MVLQSLGHKISLESYLSLSVVYDFSGVEEDERIGILYKDLLLKGFSCSLGHFLKEVFTEGRISPLLYKVSLLYEAVFTCEALLFG